ncbi:RNA-directed DNA polymerase, eukaryota [Tanacetum coccineum]
MPCKNGMTNHACLELVSSLSCDSTRSCVWDLNGSGDFMVKDVRFIIDDFMLPKEPDATRWIKCVPIKVNVFAWKVRHDRLATKSNLILRGISLDSSTCLVCSLTNEDVSHILLCCDLASLV